MLCAGWIGACHGLRYLFYTFGLFAIFNLQQAEGSHAVRLPQAPHAILVKLCAIVHVSCEDVRQRRNSGREADRHLAMWTFLHTA